MGGRRAGFGGCLVRLVANSGASSKKEWLGGQSQPKGCSVCMCVRETGYLFDCHVMLLDFIIETIAHGLRTARGRRAGKRTCESGPGRSRRSNREHRAGKRIAGRPGRPSGHLGAPVGVSELLGPAPTRLIRASSRRPGPVNPGREVWRPVRRGLRCRSVHLCGFIIRGGRPPRVHAQRGGTAHLRRPHAGRLRHSAQAFRGPHGIGLSGTASAKPPLSREAALPPWGRQANGPKPQRTGRPQPHRRRPRLGDAAQGAARVRGDLRSRSFVRGAVAGHLGAPASGREHRPRGISPLHGHVPARLAKPGPYPGRRAF